MHINSNVATTRVLWFPAEPCLSTWSRDAGFPRQRQSEVKRGPPIRVVFRPDAAAVGFEDGAAHGEADAEPLVLGGEEAVEFLTP
jgi:hypothetical protein